MRLSDAIKAIDSKAFQFTHPGRGATASSSERSNEPSPFQFTHPGRGATQLDLTLAPLLGVSIHAPREGCDYVDTIDTVCIPEVSIHAPREGCDTDTLGVKADLLVSIHAPREGCDY